MADETTWAPEPRPRSWRRLLPWGVAALVLVALAAVWVAKLNGPSPRAASGAPNVSFSPVATLPSPTPPPSASPSPSPTVKATKSPKSSPTTAEPHKGPDDSGGGSGGSDEGDGSDPDPQPFIEISLTTDDFFTDIGTRTVHATITVKYAATSHKTTVIVHWNADGDGDGSGTQRRVLTGPGRFTEDFTYKFSECGHAFTAMVEANSPHPDSDAIPQEIELMGWICNG